MLLDLIKADLLKNVDGLSQTYYSGIVGRTCFIALRCILVFDPLVAYDSYGASSVEFGRYFLYSRTPHDRT